MVICYITIHIVCSKRAIKAKEQLCKYQYHMISACFLDIGMYLGYIKNTNV